MSGNIIAFEGSKLPSAKSLASGLANVRQELSASEGPGGVLLRLSKQGDWVYGAENVDMEDDATLAVNPMSMAHGWILWEDGSVAGENMVPITDARPDNPGRGWSEQYSLGLKITNGEDAGVELVYKGTSLGLKKAFRKLIDAIDTQLSDGQEDYVPLIELGVDSYRHKQYGKIFTPELSIVGWMTMAGDVANEEAGAEAPAKTPATRRRRKS